jgi:hypothetical protein
LYPALISKTFIKLRGIANSEGRSYWQESPYKRPVENIVFLIASYLLEESGYVMADF